MNGNNLPSRRFSSIWPIRSCSFHLPALLAEGLRLLAFRSRRDEREESGAGAAWEHLGSSCDDELTGDGVGRSSVPLAVVQVGAGRTGHSGPVSPLELLTWPPSL